MPRARLRLALAGCAAIGLVLAHPAAAQDDRRVSTLEKEVRELRAIVFQGRDTGQPVVVKPEGPDPQVVALQARVDTLEEQLRQMTGREEVTGHDLDEARRGLEQARAEASAARQALSDRIAKLETQGPPPTPTAAPTADLGRSPPQDAAPDRETPPPPPAVGGLDDAVRRLAAGDNAGAQADYDAYLAKTPAGPRAPEAHYGRGQALYAAGNFADAARDFAIALHGWPKSRWAPEATVRLAQALIQLDRNPQACGALGEFGRRYAATASAALKTRAAAARARAQCSAE